MAGPLFLCPNADAKGTQALVTQAPSAAESTPDSDERETLTLPGEDGQAAPEDKEPSAQDSGAKPEEVAGPSKGTPEYFDALQSKLDQGEPLTTAEKADLRTENQRRVDQERAQEQRREQAKQAEAAVATKVANFGAEVHKAATTEIEQARTEGRAISPRLLGVAVDDALNNLVKDVTPFVMLQHNTSIKDALVKMVPDGHITQREIDALEGETTIQHIVAYGNAMLKVGRSTAPDAKKVAALEKETGEQKAQIERLTTQLNGKGTASTQGKESSGAGNVDLSTKAQARNAHAKGQITTAQMRSIRDNPSIPDGY